MLILCTAYFQGQKVNENPSVQSVNKKKKTRGGVLVSGAALTHKLGGLEKKTSQFWRLED